MKKFLFIATLLAIAVFASAYTARNFYIELQLDQLDILNYVDTDFPGHDADFVLSVTDGIDVVSTETHVPTWIRVGVKPGPSGPAAWAFFAASQFTTPGYCYSTTFTITITYPGNTDPETNSATMSYTTAASGNAAIWLYGDTAWQLPDSIILGAAAPTPTYTVNLSTNPEGYITPTTLGPTEDVTTIYGTYTPTPLPTPATGYWTPASLTIDEDTQWTADGDNFVLNQEFVWTETYPTTYNLYVNGPDGYAVTGPVSGTTDYVATNADVNALVGEYTIAAAPEGYHWEVNPIVVAPEDFVEELPGAKSVRAQRIFNNTIEFVLVEDAPPAFTLTITAADAETNEPLVAHIYIDGVDSGYLTPYTFTEGVDYTPGVYTVVLDGYTDWFPESVTFPAVLTHDYTTNFIGTREQVTPVELSSFSATLTANLFVKLTWVSQTETNMVGYKVYRGTSANIKEAEMLDIPMVPATNTSSSTTYTVTDSNVLENNTYYYWLETIDYHETQFFGPTSVFVESVTPPVTNQTKIVKSGPNPFKIGDTYNIQLDVKTGETGTVTIYNVIGQVVRTYSVTGGSNQLVKWDGKDSRGNTCGSGIYFYKLSTPSVNQSKKIVVVK
jgi:hypothetical protein